LTAFSQKGTDSIPNSKCFTIPTVKEIIKDLISGDSAKSLLKVTERQLIKCEEKSSYQDSVINKQSVKIDNLNIIVLDERIKYGVLEDHTKNVEKSLKFERIKNKITKFTSIGIIGVLTYFLIIK